MAVAHIDQAFRRPLDCSSVFPSKSSGVKVVLNGNMEVVNLTLNGELTKNSQEETLKSCFNEALKRAQRLMAKKMQEMGGFPGMN